MAKLKRLAAPKFWQIEKKTKKFALSLRPGTHAKENSIPLGVVLRDILRIADNLSEVKQLMRVGIVKVDEITRNDYNFPIGIMDILTIENMHCMIIPSKRGFTFQAINENESLTKLLKIVNKTSIRKGITQLNFHDGRNLIVDNDVYKTGDVVVFDLKEKKIKELLQFKRGVTVIVEKGKNKGYVGKVEDVIMVRGSQPNRVVIRTTDKMIETLKDYVFVIGQESPVIKV